MSADAEKTDLEVEVKVDVKVDVKTYVFKVPLKCKSCVKRLSTALDSLKGNGIEEYEIQFEDLKVEVKATLPPEDILNAIKSAVRQATLLESPECP